MENQIEADYCKARVVVLGCGNTLFGDDGFGPEAVEYLKANYEIPGDVYALNCGISVRELLFTITLSDIRPERIIIVDAMDVGKTPGEVFEVDVTEIPEIKIDDFSMHQLPTSNLLKELKNICGVDVRIISAQVQHIPGEVSPGLSKVIQDAIPAVCEKILSALKGNVKG
jgi:coenzyme F420 hydrogenase subunit delta